MANRRNVLYVAGAIVVVLVVALVVWRNQPPSDDSAQPKPPDGAALTFPAAEARPEPPMPDSRDPYAWPFTASSIWNLPLGADAQRIPAGMKLSTYGVGVDEDILVLEPDAPRVDVVGHTAGWDAQANRCLEGIGPALYRDVPIPHDFVTDPGFLGATPNHAAAILLADGDTVIQTQPLHRCSAGGPAVSQYEFESDSLHNGDGIAGAHGGSRMSSIGGTLRLGELVPGGAIRHALKLNVDCEAFCSFAKVEADGKPGYRWPALAADYEAPERYKGKVAAMQMGGLLALPPDFDVDALRTEPARMVARALMRYGAYVVDDTRYPILAITTEWSPDGRVIDEFEAAWGFKMHDSARPGCTDTGPECAWINDFGDMLPALQVINNNGPRAVGGGGDRLTACAPDFALPTTTTTPGTTTATSTTETTATTIDSTTTTMPSTDPTVAPTTTVAPTSTVTADANPPTTTPQASTQQTSTSAAAPVTVRITATSAVRPPGCGTT